MKLWYQNKLDQEREMSFEDIKKGFEASVFDTRDMPLERELSLYIGSGRGGLNCSCDDKDFESLVEYVVANRNFIEL